MSQCCEETSWTAPEIVFSHVQHTSQNQFDRSRLKALCRLGLWHDPTRFFYQGCCAFGIGPVVPPLTEAGGTGSRGGRAGDGRKPLKSHSTPLLTQLQDAPSACHLMRRSLRPLPKGSQRRRRRRRCAMWAALAREWPASPLSSCTAHFVHMCSQASQAPRHKLLHCWHRSSPRPMRCCPPPRPYHGKRTYRHAAFSSFMAFCPESVHEVHACMDDAESWATTEFLGTC